MAPHEGERGFWPSVNYDWSLQYSSLALSLADRSSSPRVANSDTNCTSPRTNGSCIVTPGALGLPPGMRAGLPMGHFRLTSRPAAHEVARTCGPRVKNASSFPREREEPRSVDRCMKMKHIVVNAAIASGLLTALGAVTVAAHAQAAQAAQQTHDSWRIKRGFQISPVPLDMTGKDAALVGLGSYLVNAVGDCSGCHTNPEFAPGGNPYLMQKKKVNAAHYLAGGQKFGPFTSRNLTPMNGMPEGHTFPEFLKIIRTGVDLDHMHPQFGPLLQVMPWPTYQNMSTHDLRAIYEYLSAIPPATPGP